MIYNHRIAIENLIWAAGFFQFYNRDCGIRVANSIMSTISAEKTIKNQSNSLHKDVTYLGKPVKKLQK